MKFWEKIEIVYFGDEQKTYFAMRRTWNFLFFKIHRYIDLDDGVWRERNARYFHCCISPELNKVKKVMLLKGNHYGTPLKSSKELSIEDYSSAMQMANKGDPGIKDLLQQLKEYLILKGK